jgi:hypothetical protein
MGRQVPELVTDKLAAWRHWSSVWNWTHYTTGFTSAGITAVVASNAKTQFLGPVLATVLAGVAAGLAFLVTTLGAQTRGKGFELAAREIELATDRFQLDPTVPDSSLRDALDRGLKILNEVK